MIIANGKGGTGGWFRYSDTLASELENNGHTVCYVSGWLDSGKLKRQIQKQKPDIVHFTIEPYAMMLMYLGNTIAEKSVLTLHGSYGIRIFQGAINKKRACRMLQIIGRCITVSNYTKNRVAEEIQRQSGQALSNAFLKKTTVIYNSIIVPLHASTPSNNKKIILCIGEVKPRKGIQESLKALHIYKKECGKDFEFIIIGKHNVDSDYYKQIQNTISKMGLEKHVTMTGEISEEQLHTYYKKADLYLMPAKTTPDTFEGFGLVYIEAAAYGIPCIGTNDSGAAEAIKEGVSGYKCHPEDIASLASAIKAILLQKKISRVDCRKWAEKYSSKVMTKQTLNIYALI